MFGLIDYQLDQNQASMPRVCVKFHNLANPKTER